jgi:hypothetical protein
MKGSPVRKPRLSLGLGLALSAMTMVVAGAPALTRAADHFDAPGSFQSPSDRHDADIADVYAFPSPQRPGYTVLAFTTHPALGVITTDPTYGTDIQYDIHLRSAAAAGTPGAPTTTYELSFTPATRAGSQRFTLYRISGSRPTLLGAGYTNRINSMRDVRAFAGKVSDPFFFDLTAFNNTVQARLDQRILPLNLHGETGRQVCATTTGATDTFANFNSNAIVLEVPNGALGGKVAVWASTAQGRPLRLGTQIDRMGRPAINTVFNGRKALLNEGNDQDKNIFNSIVDPADDATTPTADGHTFHDNVVLVLERFDGVASALAAIPPRPPATLESLANVLLPDVLPFDPAVHATDGVFNGRALADDVIDNELPIVTNGLVTTDCVGPHHDYRSTFPYLGLPH